MAAAELTAPPESERTGKSKKADRKLPDRKGGRAPAGAKPARNVRGQKKKAAAGSAVLASGAAVGASSTAPTVATGTATKVKRTRAAKKRRRTLRRSLAVGAGLAVVAGGAVGYDLLRPVTGPVHTVTAPSRLLNYALVPALAKGMNAEALRAEIVKAGHGEASSVVDGVYEDRSGSAAKGGPVIILFVGGHLSGSASSFISSFTGLLPGAFVTSPGPMAGQAACVPASSGHLAECAWADNDTFGFIASPALSASALSAQLRQIRPLVEHTVK